MILSPFHFIFIYKYIKTFLPFDNIYAQIRKLAENVPSFKEGGALWFTDLTTPDSLFVLPVLTALTFWITVEVSIFSLPCFFRVCLTI